MVQMVLADYKIFNAEVLERNKLHCIRNDIFLFSSSNTSYKKLYIPK